MAAALVDPNDHDVFLMRQRIRPVINQYEFSLPDGDGGGEAGAPICFAEQKRFAFKEDIRFYADETKQVELLRIKARQRFDPVARYDASDAAGGRVGGIQKAFGESLLRSTYVLFDDGGKEVARARERSLAVALFRRLVGFVSFIGDFADWLPIPYHFDFLSDGRVVGAHAAGVEAARHLHDRPDRRPRAHARPPPDPGDRRRDGRPAGALRAPPPALDAGARRR